MGLPALSRRAGGPLLDLSAGDAGRGDRIDRRARARGRRPRDEAGRSAGGPCGPGRGCRRPGLGGSGEGRDRKSTRLNSSHLVISYAVFCLKKKNELTKMLLTFGNIEEGTPGVT